MKKNDHDNDDDDDDDSDQKCNSNSKNLLKSIQICTHLMQLMVETTGSPTHIVITNVYMITYRTYIYKQ